jgi:hypothetical protein
MPNGAFAPFMTCPPNILCPMVLFSKCHVPNNCAWQGCTQQVHPMDVSPTSVSHDFALGILVHEGTSIVHHNPQVWNVQLLGSACSPRTQVYKSQSSSVCQSCPLCIILANRMGSFSITSTLPSFAKFLSKLLLVYPTNSSCQGL